MEDVLKELKYVENSEFFTDRDGRWEEYQFYLDDYYDESFADHEKRIIKYFRTASINFTDKPYMTIVPFGMNPIVECYDEREKATWATIQMYLLIINSEKVPAFVKVTAKEIGRIAMTVEKLQLPAELEFAQVAIFAKLQNLKERVLAIHTNSEVVVSDTPYGKLKWLGKTNLLTTLFYELWKGQKKDGGEFAEPLIECDTKEQMMIFIRRNFLNEDGLEISPDTVKDYLDDSKPHTRLQPGYRIEIPVKRKKKGR